MEPEGSLPHSQQPVTCPYLEQDPSSPCPPSHFCTIRFNIILRFTPGSSKWSPCLRFPTKTLLATVISPYVLHALPVSVFFTSSPKWYSVRSTEHKALCYVVFSTPLLPRPSWAQISSSAPYFRTPSAYVPPSM